MRKKLLLVALTATLLALTACGSEADYNVGVSDKSPVQEAVTPETAEDAAANSVEEAEYETEVMGDERVKAMEPKTMYANTKANVRKGPGTANEAIGSLSYQQEVIVDGYTDDGWYRILYNDQPAYVSMKLLQEEVPIVEAAVSNSTTYTNQYCTGLAKEIFDATNTERVNAGLPALIWDDRLASPAGTRAQEIITNFSHVRTDGTKCYALSDLIYGENIARGPHATGAEFVAHWMASEGHKANILKKEYKTMAVGWTCTEQGDTAVQLFGIE